MSVWLIAPTAKKMKQKESKEKNIFKNYTYKAAILNSTAEEFKPDRSQEEVINDFSHNDSDDSTELIKSNKSYYYIAKPIRRYQTKELIGAHFVYVKSDEMSESLWNAKIGIALVTIGGSALTILLVNLWLKQYVVRPLNRMVRVAEAVSQGDMDAEFERISNDEVGRLAEAFRRMKESLARAMKKLEDYRIQRRSNNSPQE